VDQVVLALESPLIDMRGNREIVHVFSFNSFASLASKRPVTLLVMIHKPANLVVVRIVHMNSADQFRCIAANAFMFRLLVRPARVIASVLIEEETAGGWSKTFCC
jgi:hypothetical protein